MTDATRRLFEASLPAGRLSYSNVRATTGVCCLFSLLVVREIFVWVWAQWTYMGFLYALRVFSFVFGSKLIVSLTNLPFVSSALLHLFPVCCTTTSKPAYLYMPNGRQQKQHRIIAAQMYVMRIIAKFMPYNSQRLRV